MTATTAPLPGDYLNPTEYVRDLMITAYPATYLLFSGEGVAESEAADTVSQPAGVAELQRWIADDPKAAVPDFMRASLRAHADEVCPCGCLRSDHHGLGGFECPCGQCGPRNLPDDD